MTDPQFVVAEEVAKRLGITTTTLYAYVNGDDSLKASGQALLNLKVKFQLMVNYSNFYTFLNIEILHSPDRFSCLFMFFKNNSAELFQIGVYDESDSLQSDKVTINMKKVV